METVEKNSCQECKAQVCLWCVILDGSLDKGYLKRCDLYFTIFIQGYILFKILCSVGGWGDDEQGKYMDLVEKMKKKGRKGKNKAKKKINKKKSFFGEGGRE